jgi:hypothetical protein
MKMHLLLQFDTRTILTYNRIALYEVMLRINLCGVIYAERRKSMQCENAYCIYQKENKCYHEKISINSLGMCDDCIIVSLEENFLAAEKEKQLLEINDRWKSADK